MSIRAAALWSASSQYLGFAIQFVGSVLIARFFLGPEEVGLFSFAFALAALVNGLQDFGLTRYVIGAAELDARRIRQAFWISVAVAAFICGTTLLLSGPVTAFYGDPRLGPILTVIGLSYVFIPFSVVPLALMQRRLDFRGFAFVDITANACNIGIALAAAWQGFSALSLAFGVFGYQLARAAITTLLAPRFKMWPPTYAGSASVVGYGLSASLLSLTGTIGARAPELIVGKLIGSAGLGLYGRATGLALQARLLVAQPLASVFYPALARARERGEDLGGHYLRLTGALCALAWTAMAGLAVAAEPLVRSIYGDRWVGAAPVLTWVALAQLFFLALPMQLEVAYMLGRWRRIIVYTILETLLSIALVLVAAPFGLIWVAASRVLHGAIWWIAHAVLIRQLIGFRWRDLLAVYAKCAAVAGAAVAPLLAGYAVWLGPSEMGFGPLAVLCAAGAGCWALALHAVRHPNADDLMGIVRQPFSRAQQYWRRRYGPAA